MFAKIKRWWKNLALKSTFDSRLSWMRGIIGHLNQIYENDEVRGLIPEVIERIDYFRDRYVPALPQITNCNSFSLVSFEEPKNSQLHPLFVAPILVSDRKISPVAERLVGGEQTGSYSTENHNICLIDRGETSRFMAATLLHEIGHAMAAEVEGRAFKLSLSRDKASRLEEELRMWTFDWRLAVIIGGDRLQCQMTDTAKKIYQAWSKGVSIEQLVNDGLPLDLCYGPVKGKYAKNSRTLLYLIYCQLAALEMFPDVTFGYIRKLQLMEKIYSSHFAKQNKLIQVLQK